MEQDNIEIKSEIEHKTGKGVKAALVALGLLTVISTFEQTLPHCHFI